MKNYEKCNIIIKLIYKDEMQYYYNPEYEFDDIFLKYLYETVNLFPLRMKKEILNYMCINNDYNVEISYNMDLEWKSELLKIYFTKYYLKILNKKKYGTDFKKYSNYLNKKYKNYFYKKIENIKKFKRYKIVEINLI
jgi:hypothetical protein